jgi:hypothetical protein
VDHELTIQLNGRRRLLFGLIAALLIAAFAFSVDFERDFGEDFSAGTVVYFALVVICLAVAGFNSLVTLDTKRHEASFSKRIFGLTLHNNVISLATVRGVLLQSVQFLRRKEMPQQGPMTSRLRGYMERRNVYFKLYLETDEKRHFVEDSTDSSELESAATTMSQFLSVPLLREEL